LQSSKIVVYPFDQAMAAQAFRTAGWTPGPDGVLRDSSGQRFTFQYMTGGTGVRQAPVLQDDWRKVGVDMEIELSSPQLSANLEYQASFTGIQGTGNAISFAFLDGRFHSRNVARPENRWGGQNRSAYVDPESDSIVERLLTALDQTERWNLEGDLANLITRNAVFFWYYHPTAASTTKKGLSGVKPSRAVGQSGDLMLSWNIADWDLAG
jgi:peptide/nickel transport system substrate-binding protein